MHLGFHFQLVLSSLFFERIPSSTLPRLGLLLLQFVCFIFCETGMAIFVRNSCRALIAVAVAAVAAGDAVDAGDAV